MKASNFKISIIIPALNEEKCMADLVSYLKSNSTSYNIHEIIIVDGGSSDATVTVAKKNGATVIYAAKGRAKQLNKGAQHAKGGILYFLHADTLPPKNFDTSIIEAVRTGNPVGCFQMKFDSNSRFLSFFAWFTRINHYLCRGGDQSLFITRDFFQKTNGYNENYTIYEDNEFIRRIYKMARFKILPFSVTTSARRYEAHGEMRLQYHFGIIHFKNYLGAGPEQLYDYYQRKIALR